VLAATAVVVAFQNQQSAHPVVQALFLTLLCALSLAFAAGLAGSLGLGRRLPGPTGLVVVQLLVSLCAVRAARFESGLGVAGPPSLAAVLSWGAALAALVALWGVGRSAAWGFWATLALQATMLVLVVEATPYLDDVPLYVNGGLHDLVQGHLPYGGSTPNPFGPQETAAYLASELVRDGHILIGFPYLPGILLADLPGYAAGDYRYAHLAALLVLAVVWRRLAVDRAGRALAVLAVMSPYTARLVGAGWVEPMVMLGVGALALAVARGWRARGVLAVAFLLASKQYVAPVIAFLVPVWRRLGWRVVAAGVLLAGVVTLAFLAWGPSEFWHDVVATQPLQPYRPDSISLVVALGNHWGVPPSWALTVLPLAGGLLASAVVALRGRPGAATTAAALALGVLVTLLLSKQAFMNYYATVVAGLVTAAIAWPLDSRDEPDVAIPTPTEVGAAPPRE
jgi:hypothetical protein